MFGIHDRPHGGHGRGPWGPQHDGDDSVDRDGPHRPRRHPGRRGRGGPFGGPGGPFGGGDFGPPFGGRRGGPGGPGGFGGPGGPGRGHGPGGRGKGRRSRGDVRTAVLALLAEAPMHGYQIIQEIAERSGGSWRPSPGSVYPTVSQLADEGLVHSEKAEGRSVVHLTEEGRRHAEEHRAELDAVWSSVTADADDGFGDLRTAGRGLAGAVAQVGEVGAPEQVAEVARLLDDTRRRVYLLLAGEVPAPTSGTDGTDGTDGTGPDDATTGPR